MSLSRNRAQFAWAGLLAVGAFAGAVFLARAYPAPAPRPAPGSGTADRDVEDRLAVVERRLDRERARLVSGSSALAAPAAQAADAARGDGQEDAEEAEEAAPRRTREEWARDVVDHYTSFHAREADDPAWSSRTEAEMATVLREAELEGSSLDSVDCQSTVCRLELSHAGQDSQAHFLQHIPQQPPFDTAGFYHRVDTPDGASRTVLYVARAGHELPAPPRL
ncbi:hypothetical protein WMF20_42030 [Sorangium sp. So ce834]|uniref:hypothetical protein n=1 Tax=Sorangium sp. So ce834 TaxID=3133321 RepID=UPI003F6017E5